MSTTSPTVRHTTTTAVVVVVGIAAVVSFAHMYGVAHSHGEDWRSWLIPVSIDGLVVAASMVLVTRRRAGRSCGWLAWGALGAGVLASLAANVADAQPNLTARLLAGWPALAFAVAFELLLQQRRAERVESPTDRPGPVARTEPTSPVHPTSPAPERLAPAASAPAPGAGSPPRTDPGTTPDKSRSERSAPRPVAPRENGQRARGGSTSPKRNGASRTDEELIREARELAGRTGGPITAYALKQALNVGSSRAARLLAHIEAERRPALHVGAGSR
jgi:Protein of unknown function (DUF2637)